MPRQIINEGDYTLSGQSCWVDIGRFAIYLKKTNAGVCVEIHDERVATAVGDYTSPMAEVSAHTKDLASPETIALAVAALPVVKSE